MQITHPVNNFYLNSNLRNISSQFSAATKEVKNFLETTYEIFSFALNYNLFTVNLNHPWIYSELRTFSFSVSIKKIIIGTAGGIALLSINSFVSSKIYDLMAAHGFDVLSSKQDALQLFDFGYYTSNKIIGFLLTATVATYIGVIGPVFEESVFRGFIYNETEIWLNSNTISAKAFNIVSNGFVFGLAHLSPFQGWLNVPIFFVTFGLGCAFAGVREFSGDIAISSIMHCSHNSLIVAQLLI